MRLIIYFSNILMPFLMLLIVSFGLIKRVDVFGEFVAGAKEGLKTVIEVFPMVLGLLCAVSVLRESDFLNLLSVILSPAASIIGFPAEAVPVAIMRLVSNSAAMSMVFDIFKTYGADSFLGRLVSVMMGCTETVFYTLSLYTASCDIKDTGYVLKGAVFANFIGVLASFVICRLMW